MTTLLSLLAFATLSLLLVLLARHDLRAFRLPNLLTAALVATGLGFTAARAPAGFGDHLAGAAVGYGALALVAMVYFRLRGRDGLGGGDAKLMAGAGAWVGWQGLASVLLLGSLLALAATVFRAGFEGRPLHGATRIPLGAYLAAGLWLTWCLGPAGL